MNGEHGPWRHHPETKTRDRRLASAFEDGEKGGITDLPPIEDLDAMCQFLGSSVMCRIAVGPQAGRKALVPRPRVNLARYHGALAPNYRWRAAVTPAGRGRMQGRASAQPERSAIERHAAMSWAQRLRRVLDIDVESCVRCGKAVRVIACIEEPALIERILTHVRATGEISAASLGPPSTTPPERT